MQNKKTSKQCLSGKKKHKVIAIFSVLICFFVVVSLWLFFYQGRTNPVKQPKSEAFPLVPELSSIGPIDTPNLVKADVTEDEDLVFNQAMKDQFLQVADLYEANSRYPVTSIPVVGQRFAEPIKPFEEAELESIYPKDENDFGNPIRLKASVEKMQYFQGEQIIARLIVTGGDVDSHSQIQAEGAIVAVERSIETELRATFEPVGDGLEFRAVFDTQSVDSSQIPREAMVKIVVAIGGDLPVVQTVPFFYTGKASARVEGVGHSQAKGAFLNIPLLFSVYEAGYYFVDAILDDAASGEPMVQLQTQGRLRQGNDVLTLEAHLYSLKDAGSPGPYNLRIVDVFRGSVPEKSLSNPGLISKPSGYHIDAVAFAEYEDIPYVDPAAQERIDFLRSIGQGPEQAIEEQSSSE